MGLRSLVLGFCAFFGEELGFSDVFKAENGGNRAHPTAEELKFGSHEMGTM